MFTNITMFTYIRSIKCNVQILDVIKYPAKCFFLVIIKIPKTIMIIPLWPSYYIPQNTINQAAIKHYNQFRSVRTEALIWFKITIDIWKKLKVGTTVKEIYQQLLDFITIYVLKIEQQHPSDQDIITWPMTTIINSYINKHPISWELVHSRLLQPY